MSDIWRVDTLVDSSTAACQLYRQLGTRCSHMPCQLHFVMDTTACPIRPIPQGVEALQEAASQRPVYDRIDPRFLFSAKTSKNQLKQS